MQTAKVVVSDRGYEPARVTLRAGTPARITFVRTSETTCGTEVVLPSLGTRRTLPLNEPVAIDRAPDRGRDGIWLRHEHAEGLDRRPVADSSPALVV